MPRASYQFEAIGTQWSIDTAEELSESEQQNIAAVVEDFADVYSRFQADSLVCAVRVQAPGTFSFPVSIVELYGIYETLHSISGGKINPLVGSSLEQLGYGADYSLRQKQPMPAPEFATSTLHDTELSVSEPVLLDVGAVGKGYLVDQLAALVGESHSEYVVDGSGDIALNTKIPDVIGLEHPLDPSRVIGTVKINHGSLCASAINRRAWGDGLHHIIDATTGRPLETDIIATWAIADRALISDALSTGLFFVSPQVLRASFGDFTYVIMKRDDSVAHNVAPKIGEIFA